MKARYSILFVFLIKASLFYGQDTCAFDNNEIHLWSSDTVKKFINYYSGHHGNGNSRQRHTKAYYLNSKSILFLDSFARDHSEFHGFNVYFVVYPQKTSNSQAHEDQALLSIAPATITIDQQGKKHPEPDYNALLVFFNSLQNNTFFDKDLINKGTACPGNCDDSVLKWWKRSESFPRLTRSPQTSANTDSILFFDSNGLSDRKDRHLRIHGSELNHSQTRSIFFNRDIFLRLGHFLRSNNNLTTFPLVGFYYGSYNRKLTRDQENSNQTTLFIIPLEDNGQYCEPAICKYIQFVRENYPISKRNLKQENIDKFFDENHGSLCPNYCPTR